MRCLISAVICLIWASHVQASPPAQNYIPIKHIIVLYLENRSFDNLYGSFPGANGIDNAGDAQIQVNEAGFPYLTLPPVLDGAQNPPAVDTRFPASLPNRAFNASHFVSLADKTPDMLHRFYQEQAEIDEGRMDKYVLLGKAGAMPMGYFDGFDLPLWSYARKYTITDNFFHAAYGGSFLNHFWLICACTPVFPNAPPDSIVEISNNAVVKDGAVTPDGYAVNTLEPTAQPHPAKADPAHLLPPQTMPTIGDRLTEKGINWAWYAGGYAKAVAGQADPLFEYHHQPFLYFANYAEGTKGRADHLKDESDFLKAIDTNTLPAVSFWKPLGEDDEHPGYASILTGEQHVADIIRRIQNSGAFTSSVIIVTYDENGGQWDHVAPPHVDRWGEGTRVPTIVVSPFVQSGTIDHTVYDTTSILRLIEDVYGLAPLGTRDAQAHSLAEILHFDGQFIKPPSQNPSQKQ